jgi:hypothetical protein
MKTYFIHTTTALGSRVTFAARPSGDDLLIATAQCNPKDQFTRRLGRVISEGRLDAGKVFIKKINENLVASLRKFTAEYCKQH